MRAARVALALLVSAAVGVGLAACGANDNGGTVPVPGSSSTTAGGSPSTTAATIPGGG